MSRFELKVPPDPVAIAVAGAMWVLSMTTSSLDVPLAYRAIFAIVLFGFGALLVVAARMAFSRARTTFSPLQPNRSSHVVTGGVYRFTRNPMYLGTLLALLALAALLANPFSLVASAAYVAYMNRFQIAPEERVLRTRFGSAYEAYAYGVRRWM